MKRTFRRLGVIVAGLALVLLGLAVAAEVSCHLKRTRDISIDVSPIPLRRDAASIAAGKYLYDTRGCAECHGADGSGKVVIDAPNGFMVAAPDITQGSGGVIAGYQAEDWVRTIRHGVKPSSHPLFLMPSEDYNRLSDDDLSNLVAYVRSLPPVAGSGARIRLPLLMKALYGFNAIKDSAQKIDHSLLPPPAAPATVSAAHGAYVATMCSGCHGPGFSGGKIPGTPPDWPAAANLTPGTGSVMPSYDSLAKFSAMLRSGLRPDGTAVSKVMPFASLKNLDDTDIAAIYLFLQTLPAEAKGNR